MEHTQRKDNSLKVRFDTPTYSLMEEAGSLIGMDRSKFVRFSVESTAKEIIAQHEKTSFSEKDWVSFFDMVENQEVEPTSRMKKAAHKYRKIVGS
jgi:uncharacterized protein (DUF1778 family)